jgi:hypothetical protein
MYTMDDQTEVQGVEDGEVKSRKMNIQLSHLSDQLEGRIENRITKFEEQYETPLLRGNSGVIPRVTVRDYIFEIGVGVILTLYLIVEVFIV